MNSSYFLYVNDIIKIGDKMNKTKPTWKLDIPESYYIERGEIGFHLGSKEALSTFPHNYEDYEDLRFNQINLINNLNQKMEIKVPENINKANVFCDLTVSATKNNFPSIREGKSKLVSLSFCTRNWDGIMESSLLTVDIENKRMHNQYWSEAWVSELEKAFDIKDGTFYDWTNGALDDEIRLNNKEDKLLLYSSISGQYYASIIFIWTEIGWEIDHILKGQIEEYKDQVEEFFN